MLVLLVIVHFRGERSAQWLSHSQDVKSQIRKVVIELQNAEASERSFFITQTPGVLTDYTSAVRTFASDVQGLRASVADNPVQVERTHELERLAKVKFQEIKRTLELVRAGYPDSAHAYIMAEVDNPTITRLREVSKEMIEEENRLLDQRQHNLRSWRNLIVVLLALSLIILIISLVVLYGRVKPLFNELQEAKDLLEKSNRNMSESLLKYKKLSREREDDLVEKEELLSQNQQLLAEMAAKTARLDRLTQAIVVDMQRDLQQLNRDISELFDPARGAATADQDVPGHSLNNVRLNVLRNLADLRSLARKLEEEG